MRIKVFENNSMIYQWDTGRKLIVEDDGACNEVHFSNTASENALVVPIKEQDGVRLVEVPNILLQKASALTAYLYHYAADGSETRYAYHFPVRARPKPEGYLYTETEVLNYSSLNKRLEGLEGEGLANAVAAYLKENPADVPSGGGVEVTGAEVGQTIQVSAVDENGVPTAWEPVDFPSDELEELANITLEEDAIPIIPLGSNDEVASDFKVIEIYMTVPVMETPITSVQFEFTCNKSASGMGYNICHMPIGNTEKGTQHYIKFEPFVTGGICRYEYMYAPVKATVSITGEKVGYQYNAYDYTRLNSAKWFRLTNTVAPAGTTIVIKGCRR